MSVLEFGSGTGGITEPLLRRGSSVVCVDQAATMIAHAQRRAFVRSFEPPTSLRRAVSLLLLLPLALLACSGTKRPALYPNALYEEVGEAAAQEDVNHCMEVARSHGLSDDRTAGDAARGATIGSVIGAAIGGAVGWVLGNPGRGAAAGAAGGGTRGAVKGATQTGDEGNVYRRFVDTCLREIGYQPIGWR